MKRLVLFYFLLSSTNTVFSQYSYHEKKLIQDLKVLSAEDMEGRNSGSKGSERARNYIIGRLKESGAKPFTPDYLQPFTINEVISATNILAVIPGKLKETIVISAHYDHVGIQNNQIYNGADDNASGVATLLAMVKYFKKNHPDHRLIFAFFDGEEKGLKGSAHFVNTIDLQKENIVLNVNLDMVSRSEKNELFACGSHYTPALKSILEKVKKPEGCTLLYGHDDPAIKQNNWTSSSDHYHFHAKKIPFIYFGVEDHPDYHKPTDDFEKVNQPFFCKSAETILQSVVAFDKHLQ